LIGNFFDQFWSLTFGGLSLGFIYILIALGYTLVYGVLRMINFANSEIFMVGTFATVIVIRDVFHFTQSSEYATGVRLWFILATALVISMLVSGLLSMIVELVAYRRLRRRNSGILAPLISAIGVSMVLAETVRIMTDSRPVAAPRAMDKTFIGQFFDAGIRLDNTIIVIAALALFIALTTFINKTRMGKGIRAVSMNPNAARLMGINIDGVISATFLIGGLMTGAAGFFYVLKYENTASNIGFELGIAAFTAAILGGIGNIKGAFFGGLALGLLETYASFFLGTQWKAVTVFIVLVLVLYTRPNGLFGESMQQSRV
jgi:branched-chain amino acid transport system permease protein